MERRKARRPRMAGCLWPFPETGSAARRATGAPVTRTSAVQRSIPLVFFQGERTKAPPARHDKRAAELWLFDK
jgi:hypothetical protein